MKLRLVIIIIFLIGFSITIFGGVMKILHFSVGDVTGNVLLIIGLGFKVLSVILAIIGIIMSKSLKSFIENW